MAHYSDEPWPDYDPTKRPQYPDEFLDAPPMSINYQKAPKELPDVPGHVKAISSIFATLFILGVSAVVILVLVAIFAQVWGAVF